METDSHAHHKGHPQLKKIIDEIKLRKDDAALPDARFTHWLSFLRTNFPRSDNNLLYGQMLTMALKFAQFHTTAAYQLFVLSSIGLNEAQVEKNAAGDPFVAQRVREATHAKTTATGLRAPTPKSRSKKTKKN